MDTTTNHCPNCEALAKELEELKAAATTGRRPTMQTDKIRKLLNLFRSSCADSGRDSHYGGAIEQLTALEADNARML